MRILIKKYNEIVCEDAQWAKDFWSRMIGLLGKRSFTNFDGLLLSPCSQIHSIGMGFNFDAVYLDNTYRIVAIYENIGKNKILPYNVAVSNVLELPVGTVSTKNLEVGDVLKVINK